MLTPIPHLGENIAEAKSWEIAGLSSDEGWDPNSYSSAINLWAPMRDDRPCGSVFSKTCVPPVSSR